MRGFQPNTKNRARREKLAKRAPSTKPAIDTQHAATGPRSRKKEKQLARANAHAQRDAAAAAAAAALVAPAGGKRAMLVD